MPWKDQLLVAGVRFRTTNLDDRLNLAVEPCRTTLDQGNVRSQAHLVDVSSRIKVVKRIEDNCEALEPFYVELRIFDVGMVRFEFDVRVELGGAFFCDLNKV